MTLIGDRAKLAPYLDAVCLAADEQGIDRAILAAILFRESRCGLALTPAGPAGTGDLGHGHGLCQIDDRTWGDWIKRNDWRDPLTNLRKGAAILRDGRSYLKSLSTMPGVSPEMFERAALAAYNCGPGAARKGLVHFKDPDHYTAGSPATKGRICTSPMCVRPGRPEHEPGDYSAWVVRRAARLRTDIPELVVSANEPTKGKGRGVT